jgi:hypothetical protein
MEIEAGRLPTITRWLCAVASPLADEVDYLCDRQAVGVFSTRRMPVWVGPNYIHMRFRLSPICHALWGQSSRSLRQQDDNCQTLAAALALSAAAVAA